MSPIQRFRRSPPARSASTCPCAEMSLALLQSMRLAARWARRDKSENRRPFSVFQAFLGLRFMEDPSNPWKHRKDQQMDRKAPLKFWVGTILNQLVRTQTTHSTGALTTLGDDMCLRRPNSIRKLGFTKDPCRRASVFSVACMEPPSSLDFGGALAFGPTVSNPSWKKRLGQSAA